MLASDVIALARDLGIDYDVNFAENADCFRELTRIERDLIEQLILFAPVGYSLPGDDRQEIDVSAYAESYPIPNNLWRIRFLRATYSGTALRLPIQRVDPSLSAMVPQVQPSAYIEDGGLHPIDGVGDGLVASRRFGWLNASTVQVVGVLEPTAKTAAGDVLELPDDALRAVAYELVVFFGKRARTADSLRQQAIADAKGAKESLFAAARGYPGRAVHPTV